MSYQIDDTDSRIVRSMMRCEIVDIMIRKLQEEAAEIRRGIYDLARYDDECKCCSGANKTHDPDCIVAQIIREYES